MFIYVIRAVGGPAKIGFACDPKKRMRQIQTTSPFSLRLVYILPCGGGNHRDVEEHIHGELKAFQLTGEWFDVSDEDAIEVVSRAQQQVTPKPPKPPKKEKVDYMNMNFPMLTPSQARAARAMAGLALREAATKAGMGINTLNRFELDGREPPTLDTAFKIAQFYQDLGLEFPDERTVRQRVDQAA
jgi:DNA-binding XRE family transcriptional regulator